MDPETWIQLADAKDRFYALIYVQEIEVVWFRTNEGFISRIAMTADVSQGSPDGF